MVLISIKGVLLLVFAPCLPFAPAHQQSNVQSGVPRYPKTSLRLGRDELVVKSHCSILLCTFNTTLCTYCARQRSVFRLTFVSFVACTVFVSETPGSCSDIRTGSSRRRLGTHALGANTYSPIFLSVYLSIMSTHCRIECSQAHIRRQILTKLVHIINLYSQLSFHCHAITLV